MSTIDLEKIFQAGLNICDKYFLDFATSRPFGDLLFSNELKDHGIDDIHCALVNSRFLKKYNIPSGELRAQLREICHGSYRDFDSSLPSDLNLWSPGIEFFKLRKARQLLEVWCRNYTRLSEDVEFTPGESFVPTRGDVSLIGKLANKDHWSTTWNCLEETCNLIYTTLSLKRQAKIHIGPVSKAERRELFLAYDGNGYRIFRHLLLDRVLTITDGARASSVPKNNDTDRFINIETLFSVILQRTCAAALLRVLRKAKNPLSTITVGGVLGKTYDAQEIHKRMISTADYATIDFSNASDSISLASVSAMFPKHVRDDLLKFRSTYVEFDNEPFEPNKLSSMGNGFTFEVMTLLLLAVGRTLDPTCRVFGDDVIIKNDVADLFISCCKKLGFNVNMSKTFINSPLRESCGAYFHDDYGYLTSFDLKRPKNISELIAFTNKVAILSNQSSKLSPLKDLHNDLTRIFPTWLKGPDSTEEDLSSWVFVKNASRVHSRNKSHCDVYKKHVDALRNYCLDIQNSNEWQIVKIPRFNQKVIKLDNPCSRRAAYAAFLWSRRAVKRHVRGRGKWELTLYFVNEVGMRVRVSDLYAGTN